MTSTSSSRRAGSALWRLTALGAATALTLMASAAHAGAASEAAIAESLFQDGKALMKRGALAEACPKLAESQRLDPASGTLLALALCHEQQGKLATAWTNYLEAEALARKDGSADRAKAARERATALEPKLARLEITVGSAVRALAGLEIRFDGSLIESAVWGTAMPVDPGEHTVQATATGKLPSKLSATIQTTAERKRVEIGPLEDAPPELVPVEKPPSTTEGKAGGSSDSAPEGPNAGLVAGGIVGGLGLVALGVGTYFGVRALDQIGTAQDRCSPELCTDPEAVDLNDRGRISADVSTGLFIGGGVATAVGIALLVAGGLSSAESSPPDGDGNARLRVEPMVGLRGAGVMLGGSW